MRAELQNLPEAWPGCYSWFWHGEHVLALLDTHRPMTCVELGSWFGGSAIPVARLVRQWGGRVTCVDVWESEPVFYNYEPTLNTLVRCLKNIAHAGLEDVIDLVQMRTDIAAQHWAGGSIDYLYVDADHSYAGCKSDLELWWPHLRVGGLIAGDDYGDQRFGVTEAWDEFEKVYGQQFEHAETPGMPAQLVWGVKR